MVKNHGLAVQLKNDFFKYGIHRLAGGLTNHQPGERLRILTDTFSLEIVKQSVTNMIDHPVEFTLPENVVV